MEQSQGKNTSIQESNKRLVIQHFEDFVNNKDVDAIDRNMSVDFQDHDGPGGKQIGREGDKAMMIAMHKAFPDLKVTVLEALAEGDKVMVRNVWTGTQVETGKRMEFHGFVLWRLKDGKIVERWATVTPPKELTAGKVEW
jgi:predicted SnoaL-like aldol condensation-catalyzing enzyme